MLKLSRSKIDLFIECSRCFWLNMNKGVKRPQPAPYTINSAIDYLLKQEFDIYRKKEVSHYLMEKNRIDALPYNCDKINEWRNNFSGIRFMHKQTDFLVYGAVDDVWINPQEELIVVDYKATGAKKYNIYDSYIRQMEIYQWLFIKNGYRVSKTGYFIFAKVDKDKGFIEGKLSFDLFVEPKEGNTFWVEPTLWEARKTIDGPIPTHKDSCSYCKFTKSSQKSGEYQQKLFT